LRPAGERCAVHGDPHMLDNQNSNA
jgi:hypothetical protein